MAEDGGVAPATVAAATAAPGDNVAHVDDRKKRHDLELEEVQSPRSPNVPDTPNPFSRRPTSLDLDDYFTGPRDTSKHSKWPLFMQMHGSILPKMIIPLLWMAGWSGLITSLYMKDIARGVAVNSVLLTVLGFVVGLGLSFRSSTAYERYAEGRRYWAQLVLATQTLGRVFWIHGLDLDTVDPKVSLLRKVSSMNLLLAFAVSLKHRLRFEPYTAYEDLAHLVSHLNTFAQEATAATPEEAIRRKKGFFKETGEYLGISFAASNPRKSIKRASKPTGNLPLEILTHLAATVDQMVADGQLKVPMQQTLAYNNIALLNDILTGTDRVLNTPLPIAYAISISQITWVYVMLLPFQLVATLQWIAIPATVFASYIILAILLIGREIENPFGTDVNDLPLDSFCDQIASELDIIASHEKRSPYAVFESPRNVPLYPVSMASYSIWTERSEQRVREAIRTKPVVNFESRKRHIFQEHDKEKHGNGNHHANGEHV